MQNDLNIEKITFKVVQMKFLAMHINNQKLSYIYIYLHTYIYSRNLHATLSLFNVLMIFVKRKMYNFDPYNVVWSITTNIPVLLMTAFVLQGHIFIYHIYI